MTRTAYFGGSFDPPHKGHFAIAERLIDLFRLDRFVFIPAFHAPHKPDRKPTPAIHRFAMLALATNNEPKYFVSTMEIDLPERPYTVETLGRIIDGRPDEQVFFVMGADSWMDITTWREWETVLTMTDQIVVTRPGFPISFSHVTENIQERIVDLRIGSEAAANEYGPGKIYISDAVQMDISATEIRELAAGRTNGWDNDLTKEVAKYVEKYELYT
ncbi:MAG TPA: nicotinate-nucleotide adenylyltransferase [Pyrinomonadaceae bacterium]|nr:nicotinate-nucleotide adenylyltransferase [Pyrinomonadaceae bacterium]